MLNVGDFAQESVVRFPFSTNGIDGAPIAPSTAFEAADLKIYKNGIEAQKTTTNGITMTSPFDSLTGQHAVSIDTAVDTGDVGFWVGGADYWVFLDPDETVDGVAVRIPLAIFSIENRNAQLNMSQLRPAPGAVVEDSIGEAFVAAATELGNESIVGTDYTKKTPAGDDAAVFTLDSATNPTSRVRQ